MTSYGVFLLLLSFPFFISNISYLHARQVLNVQSHLHNSNIKRATFTLQLEIREHIFFNTQAGELL